VCRLVARDEDHEEVLVELDVHGAHLALGIVDLVDALLFVLDALGVLAAEIGERGVTFVISASGILSSSSLARAKVVHPKVKANARAMVFVIRSPVSSWGSIRPASGAPA
jgi:hypothetical protein